MSNTKTPLCARCRPPSGHSAATPAAMVTLHTHVWCPRCLATLHKVRTLGSWSPQNSRIAVQIPPDVAAHIAQCFGDVEKEAKS
jgi:hypothetical protein